MRALFLILLITVAAHTSAAQTYDCIIRNGTVYDGTGSDGVKTDIAIRGDSIAFIGDLPNATAKKIVDATGLVVAPGFINMLSWADETLMKDGRSMSDIKQGVTLEVFGEGYSPGPIHRSSRDKRWRTIGEYFKQIEAKGVSTNVATFVGATSVRTYVLDRANRKPNAAELAQMKKLVADAMEQGAMGVGSSLIYAPADYASTEELIALAKVASSYGGMYTTHMRSESDRIYYGLHEAFTIAREANIAVEIYHLKINHDRNWHKIDTVINKIDSARAAGLKVTANMYTYNASGTNLLSRLPTWVQEGGQVEMRKRLKKPQVRARVLADLRAGIPQKNSNPKDVLLMQFKNDSLQRLYQGKRLDEVAHLHGKSDDETMIDLLIRDQSGIPSIFFLMSEENVRRIMKLPYVSFCSDAGSIAAELPFTKDGAHPRTYGSFARLLGKYVRDEQLIPMKEAIRRLTSLPATNLKITRRGRLQKGYFADIVVFDAGKIRDVATYDNPHQYAEGMVHVFVNGKQVLANGEHTGAMPGRAVRGPGYKSK